MLKEFTIPEHLQSRMHFKKCEFERLNILFGGNGSGKTTLLDAIEKHFEGNEEVDVISYRNSKDNERHNNPSPLAESQHYARELANRLHASGISEGQSIIFSFNKWLDITLKSLDKNKKYVIILDEIDSGLSCDHVNVIMHVLNDYFSSKKNVQLFVASNMYHWVHSHNRVFSMYKGKFIEIHSYDEYFKKQMDMQQKVGKKSKFNFL